MKEKKQQQSGMEKIATFIVDKRNLFFLLYIFALIFSVVAIGWVKVENDITAYLPADTETRQGLTVMNDNFTTFGSARVMVSNITYETAEELCDQIKAVNGVDTVEFDDTEDHYKNASALYTVTFDGTETDPVSIDARNEIASLLSGYDSYIDSEVGKDMSAELASEMGVILAIAAGDHKALKAPGVGPKTAQRVVMELRDKVGVEDMTRANADFSGMGAALAGEMTPQGEAISALVALGYSQTDAAAAVARLDSALPTDGLVRGVLKLLSRGV